jgi:hypothetical protein
MIQVLSRFFRMTSVLILLLGSLPALSQAMLQTVPENHGLPWPDVGDFTPGPYTVTDEEQESWERLYPFVAGLVSDDLIVSLSLSAIEATKEFHFVPGEPGRIGVLGFTQHHVVYEATLAELPAPPAVVRELKAFILSPNANHQLLPNRIVITIRGQRFE